ncbi:MAG: esterase/lipase family protein, partial [Planctomycetota bacterium]
RSVGPSSPAPPPVTAAPEVVPLVLVHGITGSPAVFDAFLALYGPGRHVVPAIYAQEADALQPGSLPLSVVVSAGYYQESATSTKYDGGTSSIGGAPVARTDGYAARYPISYTERLGRIVEGVRRATGSDRVDLVCHSMGNLVGRAYIRWHSDGAKGGKSKVRRYLSLAGPHRGINAAEAYGVGFARGPAEEFMRLGEIAELCGEYTAWGGKSFTDLLNDDWDGFCARVDVSYGGASAIGAHGKQVDPKGTAFTIATIATVIMNIIQGVINVNAIADLVPFANIFFPQRLIQEALEAFGPGDKVVRLAISRFGTAPFLAARFWSPFEGRHEGPFNEEQSILGATFTSELARQFLAEGSVPAAASVTSCELVLVDAPGKASWLALETKATGLVAAQVVEETLDASGKPAGGAVGYGCPVRDGEQRAFLSVPAGGGDRRYHVVLYGANGVAFTKDVTFTLTDGAIDAAPATTFASATWATAPGGAVVSATFTSNTTDPTLELSFRLDGGTWTPYGPGATFDTPALGPGEHRLEARARHAANGARLVAEDARGAAVGIFVDAAGRVTVRR